MSYLTRLQSVQKFFTRRELILRGRSVVVHESKITTHSDFPLPVLEISYTTLMNYGCMDIDQRRDLRQFAKKYLSVDNVCFTPLLFVRHKYAEKTYLQTHIS
jgi:hypothetical protein